MEVRVSGMPKRASRSKPRSLGEERKQGALGGLSTCPTRQTGELDDSFGPTRPFGALDGSNSPNGRVGRCIRSNLSFDGSLMRSFRKCCQFYSTKVLNFTKIRSTTVGGLCNRFVALPFSASNLGFSRKIFGRSTTVSYVPDLLVFRKDIRKKFIGELCTRFVVLPFSSINLGFFRKDIRKKYIGELCTRFAMLLFSAINLGFFCGFGESKFYFPKKFSENAFRRVLGPFGPFSDLGVLRFYRKSAFETTSILMNIQIPRIAYVIQGDQLTAAVLYDHSE
ncbi:hypothetical protein YC2023_041138 [Brassica napus]